MIFCHRMWPHRASLRLHPEHCAWRGRCMYSAGHGIDLKLLYGPKGKPDMERVELTRDCEAVQIPAGNRFTLEKGLEIFITQALGGTFTVQVPAYGGLFR